MSPEAGARSGPAASRSSAPAGAQMFPLPIPQSLKDPQACLLPRRHRKAYLEDVQDLARGLNWMQAIGRREFGTGFSPATADKLQSLWAEVAARGEQAVLGLGSPPTDLTAQAAYRRQLRGRGVYDADAPSNLAPFNNARLSLPQSVQGAPCIAELLAEPEMRTKKGG